MRWFFILSLINVSIVVAQPTVGGVAGGMDMNTAVGGFIQTLDLRDYSPKGSAYLFDDWREATITLTNFNVIFNVPVKVDFKRNTIDIKDNNLVRSFSIEKTRFIDMKYYGDSVSRYINPYEFQFTDNVPLLGLMQVITQHDTWNLVQHHYLKVIKSTYIPALDAGVPEDRLSVESQYFLARANELYPINKSKNDFSESLNLSDEMSSQLLSFIKKNKYSLTELDHLTKICQYLNQL